MAPVKTDKVPCVGGPLPHLDLHKPYDRIVPLSDGRYRLIEEAGGSYYLYEKEGRRRQGSKADD